MQTAKVLVNIGGDAGNMVPKTVTAAEVAVLRAIHGEEAVHDIEPIGDEPVSQRDELDRLRQTYGRASDGESRSIVGLLFPGAGARVFENIAELGLPESLFKPIARASVAPVVPVAHVDPLDHDGDGKKGGSKPKKAKAAEPAPPDADDEVKEMADGDEKLFG